MRTALFARPTEISASSEKMAANRFHCWLHLRPDIKIAAAREKGLYRMEGKEYVVKDGDVLLFKFNV